MAFSETVVKSYSLERRLFRFRHDLVWRSYISADRTQQRVCIGQARIGRRVTWIFGDCALKIIEPSLEILRGAFVPAIPSIGIGQVSFRIHLTGLDQSLLLFRRQLNPYFTGDSASHLAL